MSRSSNHLKFQAKNRRYPQSKQSILKRTPTNLKHPPQPHPSLSQSAPPTYHQPRPYIHFLLTSQTKLINTHNQV